MFYVYCYYNPLKIVNGEPEPFYVGKGKNERAFTHIYASKLASDTNKHKANTIRSIISHGQVPIIKILKIFENEQDAHDYEIHLISTIGRYDKGMGPLLNLTSGGEGTSGRIVSAETRKLLSEKTKQAIANGKLTSNIYNLSRSMKGKKQTAEHIEKRASKRRGNKLSPDTCKRISEAHKSIRKTDEWKLKASASQKGKKHTDAHIKKCIENNPRSQKVEIMGNVYPSIGQAIKATGLSPAKVRNHPTFKRI